MSLVTSWKPGSLRERRDELRRPLEQLLRVGVLQHELVGRCWSACRRCGSAAGSAETPAGRRMCCSFGRISCTTSSALRRSLRRFQVDDHAAEIQRRAAAAGADERHHVGDVRILADDVDRLAAACATIASKPMSCAACVNTNSCPVSSLGRKPFGIVTSKHAGRRRPARRTTISTSGRWRTHACSVRR